MRFRATRDTKHGFRTIRDIERELITFIGLDLQRLMSIVTGNSVYRFFGRRMSMLVVDQVPVPENMICVICSAPIAPNDRGVLERGWNGAKDEAVHAECLK